MTNSWAQVSDSRALLHLLPCAEYLCALGKKSSAVQLWGREKDLAFSPTGKMEEEGRVQSGEFAV